jgi:nicotinamide mononucleotide transporter
VISWTEASGFVLALLMVLCSIRALSWTWPLAIASSLLYFIVFRDSRLYAEASLQLVYVILALWGWWQWLRRTDDTDAAADIRRMGARGWWACALSLALLWPGLAWLLVHHTDSDVPCWDAFPTALSLIGQVLLGCKHLENWPVWIVVNAFSAGLFAWKHLWLTSLLYLVFVVLSMVGWRAWQQRLTQQAS